MLCLSACSGSGSSGGSIAPEKEIAPSHQQISEPLLRFNVTSHIYNQLFWPSTIKPLVDQIGVDTDMVVLAGECGLNDNNSHHISDNILYYCTASDISRTGYLKISVFEDSIQAEPIYWEHKN